MCGRYGFGNPARFDALGLGVALPPIGPRFNVAPSQSVPLVSMSDTGRVARLVKWGLVPSWADDTGIGYKLANARADTIATKTSFRSSFKSRRGLLPADLFYEWQAIPGQKIKQPWCIRRPEQAPFAFGAIWDSWSPKNDPFVEPLLTCTIITTEPNAVVGRVHDRMPVIIPEAQMDEWLDPSTTVARAQELLVPYADVLEIYPVSLYLNSPKHDDAKCAERLAQYEPRSADD